jgi:hypothetical protein
MANAFIALIVALVQSSFVPVAACPPKAPAPGSSVWFDFQVTTPVQFIREGSVLPFPDATLNSTRPYPPDFALVQFVVDTSGVPVPGSFRMLLRPDGLVADSVSSAMPRWRFKPALVGECRVSQVVLIALRWK